MYSPYGNLISWEQAREVIPRMAKATVQDLETGLTFNVQRRAGSSHADVQPLTAEDTKILKEIYGGRWSWKRRAIVVEKDGYKIAASMNGMPHGQGAITGNNFPGHFCIHFMDSTTHSNNLDLAHQLMVHKAAGLIEDYIKVQGPKEIVEIALTAIGQNDYQILVLTGKLQDNMTELFQYMPKIIGFKINALEEGSGTNFLAQIEWYESTSGRNIKEEVFLTVVKSHGMWVVDLTNLLELVQKLEKEN